MCGIIISNLDIPKSSFKFIEKRGPDNTNIVKYKDITFIHFLLHLTGSKTLQPLIDENNNIVVIFNGEIYNYKEILNTASSDIYSIMHSYKKYGLDFINYLDGEFTIVIFDFNKNYLILSSDIFKTKPLFYKIDSDNIIIASYESTCNEIKKDKYNSINPNEMLIYNLNNKKLLEKRKIHNFDLQQHKNNYDDYIKALEESILKRYPENSVPLVTLSSGLDSGSIACCLNKYNKKAYYYSIPKNESYQVLQERRNILKNHKFLDLTNEDKIKWNNYLINNCEKFFWTYEWHPKLNHSDNGFIQGSMLGKSKIIDDIKDIDKNVRVLFSGIGADEIMARNQFYSLGYGNVNEFTEDLNDIFPWVNFYNGVMENYLRGEEYVGGCFSFETRYPFCDKYVVQEFLWLSPELKNIYKGSIYKPPLLYYLDMNNFPLINKKLGFSV